MTGHETRQKFSRRTLLRLGLAAAAGAAPRPSMGATDAIHTRPIPATGERIPVIGMGTWIVFNVGNDPEARAVRTEIMREFLAAGGGMIDSSPMYASAEDVIGHGLERLGPQPGLFSATKVWTSSVAGGPEAMEQSRRLWGVDRFDLIQVHNLLSWEGHLETLFAMKAEGRLRHVGITTSHGRRHDDFERIMRTRPIDFVQLTYNAVDREAERRLLPIAAERGIAVIANRPFRRGALVDRAQRHPVPDWANEIDCENWPQILLKYIVSHPAVTCAIPATGQVPHMRENMGALAGAMPDAQMRRRIAEHVADL